MTFVGLTPTTAWYMSAQTKPSSMFQTADVVSTAMTTPAPIATRFKWRCKTASVRPDWASQCIDRIGDGVLDSRTDRRLFLIERSIANSFVEVALQTPDDHMYLVISIPYPQSTGLQVRRLSLLPFGLSHAILIRFQLADRYVCTARTLEKLCAGSVEPLFAFCGEARPIHRAFANAGWARDVSFTNRVPTEHAPLPFDGSFGTAGSRR